MRNLLPLAAAAAFLAGPALAQTTAPAPVVTPAPRSAPAPVVTPAPMPASPGTNTMTGSSNPAVNTTGNAPSNVNASGKAIIVKSSALEKGANSFTEGQAKSRLEGAGISNVTDLKKDDQGIWRGKGMHDGKTVTVGFDYKGNIAAE